MLKARGGFLPPRYLIMTSIKNKEQSEPWARAKDWSSEVQVVMRTVADIGKLWDCTCYLSKQEHFFCSLVRNVLIVYRGHRSFLWRKSVLVRPISTHLSLNKQEQRATIAPEDPGIQVRNLFPSGRVAIDWRVGVAGEHDRGRTLK